MSRSESDRRVLPFRPRGSLFARPTSRPSPVEDLGKYERAPEEPGEYRHRMRMNALAFCVTILLVMTGIWIADVMAQMRKNQDCVLMGRPGCTPVQAPPLQR
jgi:hypothetical protein